MIVCVCNVLAEDACREMAERPDCHSLGCVYRGLGGRVRCGRCVPQMRELFEEAKAEQAAASGAPDQDDEPLMDGSLTA